MTKKKKMMNMMNFKAKMKTKMKNIDLNNHNQKKLTWFMQTQKKKIKKNFQKNKVQKLNIMKNLRILSNKIMI